MADQKLSITLELDGKRFTGNVRAAGEATKALGAHAQRAGNEINAGFGRARRGVESMSRQLDATKKQLIGFFSVAQGVRALGAIKDVVVEFERFNAQLKTLTGSTSAAAREFERLKEFAATTPFELAQSLQTFIALKARGLDPTTEAMRGLGNVAAAMGKDITAVTDSALQASIGNLETMRAMGFEVIVQGDQLRVTFDGVTKTIGKNAKDLVAYFAEIGNTRFSGAMEEQMNTLGGALSNVADSAQSAAKALADSSGFTGAATGAAKALADLLGSAAEAPDAVVTPLTRAFDLLVVVLATRLTPAVYGYIAAQAQSIRSSIQDLAAKRAAIAVEQQVAAQALASAQALLARRAAAAAEARAAHETNRLLSISSGMRAESARQVTIALTQQKAAQEALTAAQARATAAANASLGIGRGLLSLLGGWPGVIGGAVTAVSLWALHSRDAAGSTSDWKREVALLRGEMEKVREIDITNRIKQAKEDIASLTKQAYGRVGIEDLLFGDWGGDQRKEAARLLGEARASLRDLQNIYDEIKQKNADRQRDESESARELVRIKKAETAAIKAELAKQIKAYEDANKAFERARDRRKEIEDTFNRIREEGLAAGGEKGGTFADIGFDYLAPARQALAGGDFEQAIRLAEEGAEALLKLRQAGELPGELGKQQFSGMLEMLKAIATQAGAAQEETAAAQLEAAQNQINAFIAKNEALKNLKVGFDQEAAAQSAAELRSMLQKYYSENPITIPVTVQEPGSGEEPSPDVPGKAGGGPIHGPGTETSDSVLARLSRGEYVIRAAAVRKYGQALFRGLNAMTLPRFAGGGMVSRSLEPAVATSRSAGASGTPLHLHLNGREFQANAPTDVAGELARAIAHEARKRGRRS